MDERNAAIGRGCGDDGRAVAIDGKGLGGVALGLVDSRIGRGVDDDVGLYPVDRLADGLGIANVGLGMRAANRCPAGAGGDFEQMAADLAAGAEHENSGGHGLPP